MQRFISYCLSSATTDTMPGQQKGKNKKKEKEKVPCSYCRKPFFAVLQHMRTCPMKEMRERNRGSLVEDVSSVVSCPRAAHLRNQHAAAAESASESGSTKRSAEEAGIAF